VTKQDGIVTLFDISIGKIARADALDKIVLMFLVSLSAIF
jgi:hypothetical protein